MPDPNFDWEALYTAQDTPWDKGVEAPPLADFLAHERIEGEVLVPGCGRGYEVRALAVKGAKVTGIDIAPTAIEIARELPRAGSERYLLVDLFALPPALQGAFDWVVEHTCFCAIHPGQRAAYVQAVRGALRPGGRVFAVFYLNPRQYEGAYEDDDKGPPYGVQVERLDELFSPGFTVEKEWVPERAFEGREQRELVRLLRRRD